MDASKVFLFAVTGLSLVIASLPLLRRRRTYLPGPTGLPALGIVFSIPSLAKKPWEKFQRWTDTYGSSLIRIYLL
jgi:hypothetical protein